MSSLIYGRNPVLEALQGGRSLNKILLAEAGGHHPLIMELAQAKRIPVQRVERDVLDKLTGRAKHQGVLAYAAVKDYVAWEELLQEAKHRGETPFLLALDHLEDPHNFGAILRVADAAGAHGVIVPKARSVSLSDAVAKTSAGAVEFVSVARVANLTQTLKQLKERGLWVVGLDGAAADAIYSFDWALPLVLVVGSEGKGLSRLVKENCDFLLGIPMGGQLNSLNASVAAAIALYEGVRRRSLKP